MPVYSGSRLERVFVQAQAANTPRTIPNTAGTWDSTGAILARHTALTLTQGNPVSSRPDKTGNRSRLAEIRGRQSGNYTLSALCVPSGAAGTPPDLAMIFAAVFGQAGTVVASTSVTYNPLDSGYLPFSIFRFNKSGGSSPTHELAGGCIAQQFNISFGGDYLLLSVSGRCVYVSRSTEFASYTGNDAVAKFGLASWPAEPTSGAPVTVAGNPINGFGGTATFDSLSQADLRGAPGISIATGLEFAEDLYVDGYPGPIVGGARSVSLSSLRCIDNDGAALNNLKTKAFTKSPIDISLAINNVAGATMTVNLKQVVLATNQIVENGAAFDINFGDSPAHASSISLTNDVSIAFT